MLLMASVFIRFYQLNIYRFSQLSNNSYKSGDSFSREAKKQGYRSRSAFKLLEINKKDSLIKKGMKILDLGSFPGGWTQVASSYAGNQGLVIAIDRKKMEPLSKITFFQMNIESLIDNQYMELSEFIPFNLVLSDLAPNISGIREKDDAEMISLLKVVFKITEDVLKKKGSLLVKIFQGESFNFAKNYMDTNFEKVRIRKPSSSRSSSSETYLLATGRK